MNVEYDWFKSYLSNRRQKVDIKGNLSEEKTINISVLQGTTLGPILFLCYINDLFLVSKLSLYLFADDTTCLAEHQELPALVDFINKELEILSKWFTTNRLALNISKTKYIIFRTKGKKIDSNIPSLNINGTSLKRVHNNADLEDDQSFKLLGIYLDEYLNFDKNTDVLCAKLTRANFCLRRSANVIPEKSLTELYHSMFHSHLLYCINVYSCTSIKNLNRIKLLQKKAIRIITKSKHNAHTNTLFKKMKILPLESLLKFKKLQFMHSVHYNYCPKSFINTFPKRSEQVQNYNLRDSNDYIMPNARIELFKKFPIYSFPQELNHAGDIIHHHNPVTFKIALEAELLLSLTD
jgi:hypothetical protein